MRNLTAIALLAVALYAIYIIAMNGMMPKMPQVSVPDVPMPSGPLGTNCDLARDRARWDGLGGAGKLNAFLCEVDWEDLEAK